MEYIRNDEKKQKKKVFLLINVAEKAIPLEKEKTTQIDFVQQFIIFLSKFQ